MKSIEKYGGDKKSCTVANPFCLTMLDNPALRVRISSFLVAILLSSSFFLVSLASSFKSLNSISSWLRSRSASKIRWFCLSSVTLIFWSLGKAAASGGITGLGGICGSGYYTTSVSGTVAVWWALQTELLQGSKRTEFTTNCIHWMEHRKCRRITRKYLLCV